MSFGPDIFKTEHLNKLLGGKTFVFLGDSNVRSLYKDLTLLSQKNILIDEKDLKTKMEESFCGDKLVFRGEMTNGRDFREERQYNCERFGSLKTSFFYLTRVYDDYMISIFDKYMKDAKPDVVIINSCLWDITRWGPEGIENYKKNLECLVKLFRENLPEQCLVVWLTAPPISQEIRGGFLVSDLQFLQFSLRYHVGEANYYCASIMNDAGFDVLDLHFYLSKFLRWRTKDGIHWHPPAVRFVTNLILTHVCLAWNMELPNKLKLKIKRPIGLCEFPQPKIRTMIQKTDFRSCDDAADSGAHILASDSPETGGMKVAREAGLYQKISKETLDKVDKVTITMDNASSGTSTELIKEATPSSEKTGSTTESSQHPESKPSSNVQKDENPLVTLPKKHNRSQSQPMSKKPKIQGNSFRHGNRNHNVSYLPSEGHSPSVPRMNGPAWNQNFGFNHFSQHFDHSCQPTEWVQPGMYKECREFGFHRNWNASPNNFDPYMPYGHQYAHSFDNCGNFKF